MTFRSFETIRSFETTQKSLPSHTDGLCKALFHVSFSRYLGGGLRPGARRFQSTGLQARAPSRSKCSRCRSGTRLRGIPIRFTTPKSKFMCPNCEAVEIYHAPNSGPTQNYNDPIRGPNQMYHVPIRRPRQDEYAPIRRPN